MKLSLTSLVLAGSLIFSSPVFAGSDAKDHAIAAKALTDGVAVRQSPDDKSPSIATLKKGDAVTASDRKGAYWKVKLADGKEGFVSVTSLQTKAGVNAVKDLAAGATAPAAAPAGAPAPSAVDSAKTAISGKIDEAKAKQDAAPKKDAETPAQKLEKAGNNLFKKKK